MNLKFAVMNKLVTFLLAFIILTVTFKESSAQDRVVNGRVYTFDSIPLINASVKIKSTKQIVYTDTLGNFYAPCNYEDQIKVWARGFSTEKVKLD